MMTTTCSALQHYPIFSQSILPFGNINVFLLSHCAVWAHSTYQEHDSVLTYILHWYKAIDMSWVTAGIHLSESGFMFLKNIK